MATSSRKLSSFWKRYLFWYRHSLWFNWLWLPVFGGMAIAPFFVRSQYADLYQVVKNSQKFTINGKIKDKYSRSSRRFTIKTEEKEYIAYCTLSVDAGTSCVNKKNLDKNINYLVNLSNYKGYNIIISIIDIDGHTILSEKNQMIYLKESSDYLSGQGYIRQSILGIIAALISISPMRYLFTIRPRRKKLKENANAE